MLRVAVLIASLLAADVSVAAAQTPTSIRGTIESATEQALTSMDIITKIPASEELDRTCAEKGQA
jgi:hypothetical protein